MRKYFGAAGCLLALAQPAGAQETYPNFVFSGRIQTQFYAFNNGNLAATGAASNFFLRRARFQVNGKIRENITFVIQPSFEGGRATGVRLRDAYIDVRLTPATSKTNFTFRMGAEKKPFGRYELASANNLPSLERNAGRGLLPVASNNLFEGGGFIATDLGASVNLGHQIDKDRRFDLRVGAYNGQGESINDVNGSKSIGARAVVDVTKQLGLGVAVFSHEGILTLPTTVVDSNARNTAFGLEGQWGRFGAPGLLVLADYMRGKGFTGPKPTMSGLSLIMAYHARTKQSKSIFAVEPVLRIDLADPNVDIDANGSTLITAGLNLYLTARAQLRMVFESQNPQATGLKTISGIRTGWTMNF